MGQAGGDVSEPPYGVGDASYRAAGGLEGIRRLVDSFYDFMESLDEAQSIRKMHPSDMTKARDKLTLFLSGWMNGPNIYRPKYGEINVPRAHSHLPIGLEERDAWLLCMRRALAEQSYPEGFREYLLRELSVPAERCRTR
ncbi:MAG: group II truncated hemoglobin [Myxococcota bacterium]|jgi:hemoglobin|nr:group II truncated hemoglobin [Myxococcota bacterium]